MEFCIICLKYWKNDLLRNSFLGQKINDIRYFYNINISLKMSKANILISLLSDFIKILVRYEISNINL